MRLHSNSNQPENQTVTNPNQPTAAITDQEDGQDGSVVVSSANLDSIDLGSLITSNQDVESGHVVPYRDANKREHYSYQSLRVLMWLSLGPEVLYLLFTQEAAKEGLESAIEHLLGYNIPGGVSGTIAWLLAGLDFIINLLLINPSADAADVLGLKKEENGKLVKEIKQLQQQLVTSSSAADRSTCSDCLTKLYKVICARLLPVVGMAINFPTGAIADFLPIHQKGWLTGQQGGEIAVAVGLIILGVSYYTALSGKDVINNADSYFLNFSNSSVVKLFSKSKLVGVDAAITALTTHAFRSSVFGYIMYTIFHDVLNVTPQLTYIMTGLGVYGGLSVSMLTRTEQAFSWFLGDGNGSKIAMLDLAERSQMLKELKLWKKLALRVPGTVIGAIRAVSIGALVYHYVGVLADFLPGVERAVLQGFVSTVIAVVIFSHGYYVHTSDMENAQVLTLKRLSSQDSDSDVEQQIDVSTEQQVDISTKVFVLMCNLASQSARGFVAVNAIYTLMGIHQDPTQGLLNVMDPKMSCALGLYCALEVGIANAKYFQPKGEKTLQLRRQQVKQSSFFRFGRANQVTSHDINSDADTGISFANGSCS